MAAKLILTRKASAVNHRQLYKVLIDGEEAGQIKNDDTEEFTLPAGHHTLQCKINWLSSSIETIDLKDGVNTYRSVSNGMKFIVPLYFMLIAGILIPFFFTFSKMHVPVYINTLKLVLILPAVIYIALYLTVLRKKYLLISSEKSNPFN